MPRYPGLESGSIILLSFQTTIEFFSLAEKVGTPHALQIVSVETDYSSDAAEPGRLEWASRPKEFTGCSSGSAEHRPWEPGVAGSNPAALARLRELDDGQQGTFCFGRGQVAATY